MNTNENNSGTLKFSKPTPNFPKGGEEIKDGEFVSSVKEETKHMRIFITESEVLELAVDSLDLMQPNPDRIHEIAERMDMVYNEDLDLFEDVEEHSLRRWKRVLKENQELKAEIERLKIAKVDEAVIKGILKKPGIVPQICANEIKKNEELKEQNGYLESVRTTQAKELTRLQALNAELLEALEGVLFVTSRPNQDCQRIEDARQIAIQAINKAKL